MKKLFIIIITICLTAQSLFPKDTLRNIGTMRRGSKKHKQYFSTDTIVTVINVIGLTGIALLAKKMWKAPSPNVPAPDVIKQHNLFKGKFRKLYPSNFDLKQDDKKNMGECWQQCQESAIREHETLSYLTSTYANRFPALPRALEKHLSSLPANSPTDIALLGAGGIALTGGELAVAPQVFEVNNVLRERTRTYNLVVVDRDRSVLSGLVERASSKALPNLEIIDADFNDLRWRARSVAAIVATHSIYYALDRILNYQAKIRFLTNLLEALCIDGALFVDHLTLNLIYRILSPRNFSSGIVDLSYGVNITLELGSNLYSLSLINNSGDYPEIYMIKRLS